jgi:hypothetical protein
LTRIEACPGQLQVPARRHIHLDSPLRGLSRYDGVPTEEVRLATRAALTNLVEAAIDRHALCWLYAERLVHKLDTFTDRQHAAQQLVRNLIWWFYADLKAYRRQCDRHQDSTHQISRRS